MEQVDPNHLLQLKNIWQWRLKVVAVYCWTLLLLPSPAPSLELHSVRRHCCLLVVLHQRRFTCTIAAVLGLESDLHHQQHYHHSWFCLYILLFFSMIFAMSAKSFLSTTLAHGIKLWKKRLVQVCLVAEKEGENFNKKNRN